jgi:hypothetical protein
MAWPVSWRATSTETLAVLPASGILATSTGLVDAARESGKKQSSVQARVDRNPAAPAERQTFTLDDQNHATIPGIPDARFFADSEQDFAQALAQDQGPRLSLSAGDADGAYGAGLLVGWTESGRRPQFSVVTGVSTGALIAPYAFLGERYDGCCARSTRRPRRRTSSSITPQARACWTGRCGNRLRGALLPSCLPTSARTSSSGRDNQPRCRARGRLEHGRHRGARRRPGTEIVSRRLAGFGQHSGPVSARFHRSGGKWPPISGSACRWRYERPFFIGPQSLLINSDRQPLPAQQLYVVVNSKLTPEFQLSERNLVSVLGRAISVALKRGTRAEIAIVRAAAERSGIGFQVVYIGDDDSYPNHRPFDPDYMQDLFRLGVRQSRDGVAFRAEPGAHARQSGVQ